MMTEAKVTIDKILSPFGLKMITQGSEKYGKAYKSYAFGLIHKIAAKWVYVVIGIVVAIVVILYLTGNLPTGR